MLSSFRNLVLISAALSTTAAFAAEQRRVEVPFSFVAKNHAYQAGSYTVSVDWARSMVTLNQIGKPSHPLIWIVMPGPSGPDPSKVSLAFDVAGPDHVLRTIRYEKYITPNLNARPKHTVETTTTIGE
ncbi:MAG: hypothetical protein QOH35_232 [Acidobacteriaceae bacterium]|jgi:hypothetical protein|nr:hypothetical protein [Acidobacteriaceae bacterium]